VRRVGLSAAAGTFTGNLDWKTWLGDAPTRALIPFVSRAGVLIRITAKVIGRSHVQPSRASTMSWRGGAPRSVPEYGRPFYWKDGRESDVMSTLYDYPNLRVAVR